MLRRSTFLPNAGVLAVLVLAAGGGQQASIKILGLTFGGMTESGHPAPIFGGLVEVVLFLGCWLVVLAMVVGCVISASKVKMVDVDGDGVPDLVQFGAVASRLPALLSFSLCLSQCALMAKNLGMANTRLERQKQTPDIRPLTLSFV